MQRKSPIQSFTGVDLKEAETVLSPQPGQMAKPRTEETRAGAARSTSQSRYRTSRLQRRVFASAANFPRPVIGGHHQPPNPLPSFAAPSPNWKGADEPALEFRS